MKNYKVIRVAGMNYQPILDDILNKYSDFANYNYQKQQNLYFANKYNYSNCFSREMNLLGNDANEIIYDFEIMQKKWAEENNCTYDKSNWKFEIFFKQIENFKPDVIYFQGTVFYSEVLNEIKTKFPFVKLLIGYTGFPQKESKGLDILFTGYPILYNKYKKEGFNTQLVYHAFDENILDLISDTEREKTEKFSFLGSSGYGYGDGHHSRYWGIAELLEKSDINVNLFDPNIKINYKDISLPKNFKGMLPFKELFPDRCRSEPKFGIDMFKALSASEIVFNMHPEFAVYESAGSMRMFEVTGVGSCLVTDKANNMYDLFTEDIEVVTYTCIDECIEKVNYLISHPETLNSIAKAGQKKVKKNHTYSKRCEQINSIIIENL